MLIKTNFVCDQRRENGRIYTRATFQDMKKHLVEHNNELLGQIQGEGMIINLSNVSHKIKDIMIGDDNSILLDIQILPTKKSKQLLDVYPIDQLEFRPRGMGIVGQDGTIQDYTFVTWDICLKK